MLGQATLAQHARCFNDTGDRKGRQDAETRGGPRPNGHRRLLTLDDEQQNHAADGYGHGGCEPCIDAFAFQESKA